MNDARGRERLRLVGGTPATRRGETKVDRTADREIDRTADREIDRTADLKVDRKVELAIERMHAAPAETHTVASLAKSVGLSRATFARRFVRATGKTPLRSLTGLRLAIAAKRLTTTDDSLAEIAWHVGYATEFALSRAFKRAYGVPPRAYRRGSTRTHLVTRARLAA